LVIHKNLPGVDPDMISGHCDHALDIALRWIIRVAKYHDIPALNRLQAIDELVNENPLLILERGHHAGAFDLHRLVQKDDDEGRDGKGDDQITKPDSQAAAEPGGRRWNLGFWNQRRRRRQSCLARGSRIVRTQHIDPIVYRSGPGRPGCYWSYGFRS